MKIIAHKGVSDEAIALGITLYKKIKASGKPGKKTIAYGLEIITAKHTATKKEIRIIAVPIPYVFVDLITPYLITTMTVVEPPASPRGEREFTVGAIAGTSSTSSYETAVVAINDTALFNTSTIQLIDLGAYEPPPFNVQGEFPNTIGKYMSKQQLIAYMTSVYNSFIANDRFEELDAFVADIMRTKKVFFSDASYIKQTQKTTGEIGQTTPNDFILGTDANGDDVALCRIYEPYADGEEIIHDYPRFESYYDGNLNSSVNGDLGKAKYYTEHFAIVPIAELVSQAAEKARGGYLLYDYETVYRNSVSEPDLTVEFLVGGVIKQAVFTQAYLATRIQTSLWSASVYLADIAPAEDYVQAGLQAQGYEIVDGIILIETHLFYARADLTEMPGAYDTVYLPDSVPQDAYRFSTGLAEDAFYNAHSVSVGTIQQDAPTIDGVWERQWYAVRSNLWKMNYTFANMRQEQHWATWQDATWGYTTSSGSVGTTDTSFYNVKYINGIVTVSTALPPSATSDASHVFSSSYSNTGIGGAVSRVDTINGTMYNDPDEGFKYDGIEYKYGANYYKNGTMGQTFTESGAPFGVINRSYSNFGLTADRTLRSWWHEPTDAAHDQEYGRYTSLIVRKGGTYIPLQVHQVYDSGDATDVVNKLYVNGTYVAQTADDTVNTVDVQAPYDMYLRFQQTDDLHFGLMNLTYSDSYQATLGGGTGQNIFWGASSSGSVTAYAHNGVNNMMGTSDVEFTSAGGAFSDWSEYLYRLDTDYNVADQPNGSYGDAHPRFDYNGEWIAEADEGGNDWDTSYKLRTYGLNGQPISNLGYHIFPTQFKAPDAMAVIHWRGATADTDGICVWACSVTPTEYTSLLREYLYTGTEESRIAVDATITVLHNNFASPQVMRAFIPGGCYTIFKD